MKTDTYDYVVVGGGTAGLVVASRLSQDASISVIVIEAGDDKTNDPLVMTPGLMTVMHGKDEYDWNFISPPQSKLNGRIVPQERGRMLGGTSSLNYQLVCYPSKASLDAWERVGNDSWNYEALAPYYRKFAKTHPPSQNAKEFCRLDDTYAQEISDKEDGPLAVSFGEGYGPLHAAWFDAFEKLGLKMKTDPRTGASVGAFQQPANIDPANKTRSSSASAYLTPEVRSRQNLTILTNTLVKKIKIQDADADTGASNEIFASGVEVRSADGSERAIMAQKEVILAAGALHTPQILELSGIGDRKIIEKHGLPVFIDNPNVGENLQDHPMVAKNFEVVDEYMPGSLFRGGEILKAAITQYKTSQEGPLGQSILASAYAPMVDSSGVLTAEARREFLDKYLGGATKCRESERQVIRQMLETDKEAAYQLVIYGAQSNIVENPAHTAELLVPLLPGNYIQVLTSLTCPFSRGSCHIISPHIHDKPVWDPRYLDEDIDMELYTRGIEFTRSVAATEPLCSLLKPDGNHTFKGGDVEAARDVIRRRLISMYDVCGSAAMKPRDAGGVVDGRLRVYGVDGLRVVDASVFPLAPVGNLQSTVYAVAERASDLIKEDAAKV